MKPRARPGRVSVGAKTKSKGKLLSRVEMDHLKTKEAASPLSKKAGRGGARAHWDIDYEEGVQFDKAKMPGEDYQEVAPDGTRRIAKKGGGR